MQFHFYEKIYYLELTAIFPDTKELPGYWLGVADNVGDSLCYHILTAHKRPVLERSVVRSAERGDQNKTVTFPTNEYTPDFDIEPENQDFPHNVSKPMTETSSVNTTPPRQRYQGQRQIFDDRRRSTGSPQRANHKPPPILRRSTRYIKNPRVTMFALNTVAHESSHESETLPHGPLHCPIHDSRSGFLDQILDYRGNRKEIHNLDDFDNQNVERIPDLVLLLIR